MNFHRHRKLLPMRSSGDVIDQLIYQALSAEVRDVEPSSRVWENICQGIMATSVSHQDTSFKIWARSFLGKALVFFNNFFCDEGWETQLVTHRPLLIFWPDRLLLVV